MECQFYMRNLQDRMAHLQTSFEKRFKRRFDGTIIPFGSSVEYLPITAKDTSMTHQFGQKTLKWIFLGNVPRAGGSWSGDVLLV